MICSHILRLNPVNLHLRFRHFTSTEIFRYSHTSKQGTNLLLTGTIQLYPTLSSILTTTTPNGAFIPFDLYPIIPQIFGSPSLAAIPFRLLTLSPKAYKFLDHLHNPAILRPSCDSSPRNSLSQLLVLSARVWLELWSAKIPHLSRTIWYKILRRRIPHLGSLHHIASAKFITSICPLCSIEPDSLLHFFFTCPTVSVVWSLVAPKLIAPQWTSHIYFFLCLLYASDAIPRTIPTGCSISLFLPNRCLCLTNYLDLSMAVLIQWHSFYRQLRLCMC